MVRRWSYINSLNSIQLSNFYNGRVGSFDGSVNSTMYLRKSFAPSTKIERRRWAKRKHLYNWLALSNVMKDWANTYRFYRKYNKFIFNQYFTSTNILAFNIVGAANTIPCLYKGTEDVVGAPITRKILLYFNNFRNPRLQFLLTSRHMQRILISTFNQPLVELGSLENYPAVPLSYDNITYLTPSPREGSKPHNALTSAPITLLNWSFVNYILTVKSFYRLCVMLTYLRIRS